MARRSVDWRRKCAELQAQLDRAKARIAELESSGPHHPRPDPPPVFDPALAKENARLLAELSKANKKIEELKLTLSVPPADSTNSGISPSKDFKNSRAGKGGRKNAGQEKAPGPDGEPPAPDGEAPEGEGKKRKIGAQRGHKPQVRKPAPPEQVDQFVHIGPESMCCHNCGGETERAEERDSVKQIIELPEKLYNLIEYRGKAFVCKTCGKVHVTELPPEIANLGLLGPNMVSLLVSLRFETNGSITGIQGVLSDVFKVKVSRGCICETINRASKCLEPARKEIEENIPKNDILNIDETSHKDNGKRLYTWVFAAMWIVLFTIGSRGGDIIMRVLGEGYCGKIGCDCFIVYSAFAKICKGVRLQWCMAHFARDTKRCGEQVGQPEQIRYSEKMKGHMLKVFEARDRYVESPTEENLELLKQVAKEFDEAGAEAPDGGMAARLGKRFVKGGKSNYTTFTDDPRLALTNNRVERIIRKIVWLRAVTQGTRGEKGRLASERYWSVRASCELQKRSFNGFFRDSYNAMLKGTQPPSILPN